MSEKFETISREKSALIALNGFCTREGANAAGVRRGMLKEGFSLYEIRTAIEAYASWPPQPRFTRAIKGQDKWQA